MVEVILSSYLQTVEIHMKKIVAHSGISCQEKIITSPKLMLNNLACNLYAFGVASNPLPVCRHEAFFHSNISIVILCHQGEDDKIDKIRDCIPCT